MPRRSSRFDPVSPANPPYPARMVEIAERRCGGMVELFNFQQTFSGNLRMNQPRPTLLDLVVSAYCMAIEDAAYAMLPRSTAILAQKEEEEHG